MHTVHCTVYSKTSAFVSCWAELLTPGFASHQVHPVVIVIVIIAIIINNIIVIVIIIINNIRVIIIIIIIFILIFSSEGALYVILPYDYQATF